MCVFVCTHMCVFVCTQADDDQVQIAGPSHAPQHHTSATKRGATNTTHAPQPAAKRARNDAAAVAAGPSRPAPHQPAAAAHPDAIEIDSDADDGQNDNNPNNPKNNPQQRQQAGGTPGKGVRVLPASLIPEGAGPPSPRVGLDDSDGVERGPTGRRVGVPWTAEETKELIELWVRLGRQGKWVKIKEIDAANKKLLSRRTPVSPTSSSIIIVGVPVSQRRTAALMASCLRHAPWECARRQ